MIIEIELVQIDMKEDFAPEVLGNALIGFFQEIDDLILCLLIGDKVEDFADEVVEDEFWVVFVVDLQDLLFFEVD